MLALAAAVVLVLSPAAPADDDFWSFLKPGTVHRHCADGSKDQTDAEAAYRRLDERIDSLTDDADVAPVGADLRALLRAPCSHLAVENGPRRGLSRPGPLPD